MKLQGLTLLAAIAASALHAGEADPTGAKGEMPIEVEAENPEPASEADSCGALDHADLVGQPASVLEGMVFEAESRVIGFGEIVTMEFVAERLTIRLDENEVIETVSCG